MFRAYLPAILILTVVVGIACFLLRIFRLKVDYQGRVVFKDAATSKFVGIKAVERKNYQGTLLYEADHSPETSQFY